MAGIVKGEAWEGVTDEEAEEEEEGSSTPLRPSQLGPRRAREPLASGPPLPRADIL